MTSSPARDADLSRRGFLKAGAAVSAASLLGGIPRAFAAGSDRVKIGLIGCGGRGTGAVHNCMEADPAVQLHAIGDLFPERLDAVLNTLKDGGKEYARVLSPVRGDRLAVPPERRFSGFDAYKQVINSGVDIVILTTPPHFRPLHIQAAIEAGVHVFAEKPVAVDPVGARLVMEVADLAAKKNLALVAGTQRRHSADYLETMARVRDGAIGELVAGQCYWIQGGLWQRERQPGWSDMEYQLRNWLYYTWLSGDHIVEQHIHNIDVMNWAFGGPPVKALGMGGRQSRTEPKYGHIYDHFSVEYEYANGARVQSFCRQVSKGTNRVGERLVGTRGVVTPGVIQGEKPWKFAGELVNGQVQEHIDMIRSIRAGKPINDGRRIAESTLTAILGRVSAYTGREISYNWLLRESKLDLRPAAYAFGSAPETAVAVPGVTPLV